MPQHTCEWPSDVEDDPQPCGLPAHNRFESADGVYKWYCVRHFDFVAGIYRMMADGDYEKLAKILVKKNRL